MITTLKNIPPYIDFGFGITQMETTVGQPVTVWLNTLYNQEAYTFALSAPGAEVTKISNYQYQLTYATAGSYVISMDVAHAENTKSLESNILNITVT
ncbi:MAG: hypothetical protein EOP54_17765 [Sphingobacteriales bacterium]|nr:MAG: hypothetical protein EOP54_17765 [Sphingobacteriales bacterium]